VGSCARQGHCCASASDKQLADLSAVPMCSLDVDVGTVRGAGALPFVHGQQGPPEKLTTVSVDSMQEVHQVVGSARDQRNRVAGSSVGVQSTTK
jgi:hypothetical protein